MFAFMVTESEGGMGCGSSTTRSIPDDTKQPSAVGKNNATNAITSIIDFPNAMLIYTAEV